MFRAYSNSWKEVAALCVLAAEVVFCSGATFTKVKRGDSAVQADVINELIIAHRERSYAQYHSHWTPDNLVAGDVAHDSAVWGYAYYARGLQHILTNRLVTQYANHTIDPTTTNTIANWTLPAWQAYTGLTNAGVFRRLTDVSQLGAATTNWLYGPAQAGDIVGAWLWEDLQVGYSALKWTTSKGGGSKQYRTGSGVDNTNCATALDEARDDWDADAWGTPFYSRLYWVQAQSSDYLGTYDFRARRHRCAATNHPIYTPGASTTLTASASAYLLPVALDPPISFVDIDGLGMQEDKLWLWTNLPPQTCTNDYGIGYMTNDVFPFDAMGYSCGDGYLTNGLRTDSYVYWIWKWQFSNSD